MHIALNMGKPWNTNFSMLYQFKSSLQLEHTTKIDDLSEYLHCHHFLQKSMWFIFGIPKQWCHYLIFNMIVKTVRAFSIDYTLFCKGFQQLN